MLDALISQKAGRRGGVQANLCSHLIIVLSSPPVSTDDKWRRQILKNRKAINFNGMFLMYPMHKDEIITLLIEDYDPFNAE